MKNIYLLLLACFIYGCKKSADTPTNNIVCNTSPSYSGQVKAIFISNCAASGCHDGVNYASLAEYNTAKDAAAQIRSAVYRGLMPLNASLSAVDKAAIICWIDDGSKNN